MDKIAKYIHTNCNHPSESSATIEKFYDVDNKPLAMKLYEISDSQLLNFGYWKKDTRTIHEAQINMVNLIGEKAELNEKCVVLDVGFGNGEQELIFKNSFKPEKIIGLNLTFEQIVFAKKIPEIKGANLNFINGNAGNLPLKSGSVDRIIVLEAAFHFSSRKAFYKEAFRVLKKRGIMVLFDILQKRELKWAEKLFEKGFSQYWAIPPLTKFEMNYNYLEEEGFNIIEESDLTAEIFHLWKTDWIKNLIKTLAQASLKTIPHFLLNYLLAFAAFHVNKNGGYYSIKVQK